MGRREEEKLWLGVFALLLIHGCEYKADPQANAVSSGAHWHCMGISHPQFLNRPPYFLPLNMAGLFDDHPLVCRSWS